MQDFVHDVEGHAECVKNWCDTKFGIARILMANLFPARLDPDREKIYRWEWQNLLRQPRMRVRFSNIHAIDLFVIAMSVEFGITSPKIVVGNNRKTGKPNKRAFAIDDTEISLPPPDWIMGIVLHEYAHILHKAVKPRPYRGGHTDLWMAIYLILAQVYCGLDAKAFAESARNAAIPVAPLNLTYNIMYDAKFRTDYFTKRMELTTLFAKNHRHNELPIGWLSSARIEDMLKRIAK